VLQIATADEAIYEERDLAIVASITYSVALGISKAVHNSGVCPCLVMEKYILDKVIGEGTYGIVYKATEKVRHVLTSSWGGLPLVDINGIVSVGIE
jgi:hypothetical protein